MADSPKNVFTAEAQRAQREMTFMFAVERTTNIKVNPGAGELFNDRFAQ